MNDCHVYQDLSPAKDEVNVWSPVDHRATGPSVESRLVQRLHVGPTARWDFSALFCPDQPESSWDFFTSDEGLKLLDDAKGGLQGILTSLSEGKELDYYKGTLSPGDRSRLNSSSQQFASEWLRSSKSNTQLAISQFVAAVLLRLGTPGESARIQPRPSQTTLCTCAQRPPQQILEDVIAMWALRAGAERAETQPKDLWLDDNRTPDIDLIIGGERSW